jgi:hypothetical protein
VSQSTNPWPSLQGSVGSCLTKTDDDPGGHGGVCAGHPQQHLGLGQTFFDREVVTVQGDAPVPINRQRSGWCSRTDRWRLKSERGRSCQSGKSAWLWY